MVTCPLAPGVPHLVSGSCSSPRVFGLGFLQTPPRGDALALLLAFGSAKTWPGDFHPGSDMPCLAHTVKDERPAKPVRLPGRTSGYPASPPTDPDVSDSLIRFLGSRSPGTAPAHNFAAPQASIRRSYGQFWASAAETTYAASRTSPS